MATRTHPTQSTSRTRPQPSAKADRSQKPSKPAPTPAAPTLMPANLLSASPQQILQLQRTVGNRAVQRLLSGVQRQASVGIAGGEVTGEVQAAIDQARGGGQPLEAGVASKIGGALGTDFSGVRVHTDAQAQAINRALGAQAATLGNDIFFNVGAYDPGTAGGQHLLAHELTHVVQQGGSRADSAQPVQRSLSVDGQPIKSFEQLSPDQIGAIQAGLKGLAVASLSFDRQVVEALIDHPERFTLTLQDVITLIPRVYQLYSGEAPVTDKTQLAAKVLEQINNTDMATQNLEQKLGAKASIDPRNADAFNRILERYPHFLTFIQQRRLGFKFNSREAKGIGGMYTRAGSPGGTVHLDPVAGKEPPDVFLRAFIHEIGHGTFQQLLIKEELDPTTTKQGLAAVRAQHAQVDALINAQVTADATPGGQRRRGNMGAVAQLAPLLSQQASLEELLKKEEAKFTVDGKTFYEAWAVLRANQGEHMLGVDMGKVDTAQNRKDYQAKTFTEFCAESFMHVVKEPEKLTAHVQNLEANPLTPPEVIRAWTDVFGILIKYRDLILENKG